MTTESPSWFENSKTRKVLGHLLLVPFWLANSSLVQSVDLSSSQTGAHNGTEAKADVSLHDNPQNSLQLKESSFEVIEATNIDLPEEISSILTEIDRFTSIRIVLNPTTNEVEVVYGNKKAIQFIDPTYTYELKEFWHQMIFEGEFSDRLPIQHNKLTQLRGYTRTFVEIRESPLPTFPNGQKIPLESVTDNLSSKSELKNTSTLFSLVAAEEYAELHPLGTGRIIRNENGQTAGIVTNMHVADSQYENLVETVCIIPASGSELNVITFSQNCVTSKIADIAIIPAQGFTPFQAVEMFSAAISKNGETVPSTSEEAIGLIANSKQPVFGELYTTRTDDDMGSGVASHNRIEGRALPQRFPIIPSTVPTSEVFTDEAYYQKNQLFVLTPVSIRANHPFIPGSSGSPGFVFVGETKIRIINASGYPLSIELYKQIKNGATLDLSPLQIQTIGAWDKVVTDLAQRFGIEERAVIEWIIDNNLKLSGAAIVTQDVVSELLEAAEQSDPSHSVTNASESLISLVEMLVHSINYSPPTRKTPSEALVSLLENDFGKDIIELAKTKKHGIISEFSGCMSRLDGVTLHPEEIAIINTNFEDILQFSDENKKLMRSYVNEIRSYETVQDSLNDVRAIINYSHGDKVEMERFYLSLEDEVLKPSLSEAKSKLKDFENRMLNEFGDDSLTSEQVYYYFEKSYLQFTPYKMEQLLK